MKGINIPRYFTDTSFDFGVNMSGWRFDSIEFSAEDVEAISKLEDASLGRYIKQLVKCIRRK